MRFTSRSVRDNFHSARREISKSYFLGIDTSTTSSKTLLIDERGGILIDFYGLPSRNFSRNLLLLW
jgi:activator of 2-hydroxyglutaryl-CoA dehydratase